MNMDVMAGIILNGLILVRVWYTKLDKNEKAMIPSRPHF